MVPLNQEPVVFAIGDSLWYTRWLPEYSTADGWYLEYELTAENGNQALPLFRSVVKPGAPNGASHEIQINNFGVNPPLDAGLYTLVGYAANGEFRHLIYKGILTLIPNFALAQPQGNQVPFTLQMVRLYQAAVTRLAQHEIIESDMQRMKIVRESREAISKELFKWEERHNHFMRQQALRNGGPDPSIIRPVFDFGV